MTTRIEIRSLLDLVTDLEVLDGELTIYATEPWTCQSEAVVAREPQAGGLPVEAEGIGGTYFMEVFAAAEFLGGWRATKLPTAGGMEQCERLIWYALDDA